MRQRILDDIVSAMKNKDKEKLSVLRLLKGAMQLEEINKKQELSDDEIIAIIAKQIKTKKETIIEFEKGNRADLIEQANKEIEILSLYMPEQLSEEEVNDIVDEVIASVNPTSVKDMGKIMGQLTPRLRGKADMSTVSNLVKEKMNEVIK